MFFKKIKLSRSIDRVIEDRFYEQVAIEMSNNNIDLGTWTRAKANADGNKEKTEALYIKYRVQRLHDAVNAVEVLADSVVKNQKNNLIQHEKQVLENKLDNKRKQKELALKNERILKYESNEKHFIKKIKPLLHKYNIPITTDTDSLIALEDNYLLHQAAWKSDEHLVSILLEADFDPERENQHGYTATQLSVGDTKIQQMIKDYKNRHR